MLWHLTKKEIGDWLESKMLAFVQYERAGSWLSKENWVDEYIYSDIHEVFFVEFHVILHEWLTRLETRKKKF